MPCQQSPRHCSGLQYLLHSFRRATCLQPYKGKPHFLEQTSSSRLGPHPSFTIEPCWSNYLCEHTHTNPRVSCWTRAVSIDSLTQVQRPCTYLTSTTAVKYHSAQYPKPPRWCVSSHQTSVPKNTETLVLVKQTLDALSAKCIVWLLGMGRWD